MSVIDQTPYAQAVGNGVTTVFPYNFLILEDIDLSVFLADVQQVLDVDYTVSGEGVLTGGNVTFLTAPPADVVVSLVRTMARTRSTSYQNLGDFNATTVNADFDRAILLHQDVLAQLDRALRVPPSEITALTDLPPAAERADKIMTFDSAGNPDVAVSIGSTVLSRSVIGGFMWPQSTAEVAAAVTPTDYSYPWGDVHRYGGSPTASGSTNIQAIQQAINVAKAGGFGVVSFGPHRYNLGTFGAGFQVLISVADLKNTVFDFGGGELFLTVTDNAANVLMMQLVNPIGITFKQPRFIAAGAVAPFSDGPKALQLGVNDSGSAEVGNVVLEQPYFEGLTSTLYVVKALATTARRIRGIRFLDGWIESCYYGPNFQQAGDDFDGDWRCHNINRAYFPYGVRRHRAKVSVFNDNANYGADACINISTQPNADTSPAAVATQDIHVDATFRGDVGHWTSLISFYHVGASGPQTHKDHSAFLNLTGATNIISVRPIQFIAFASSGGAEETTTTDDVWKNIRVDALVSEASEAGTNANLLHLRVAPTVAGSIILGPGMKDACHRFLDSATLSGFKPNNWLLYTGLRRFMKVKTGDLTAAPMAINLTNLNGRAFSLRLKIIARADITTLAGQAVSYEDIIVTGYNAGAGAVVISQQNDLHTHSTGTVSAIAVAANGETLEVSFTNYNTANARAIVDCELLWPIGETLG